MTITGPFNVVYCIIVLKTLNGRFAYILLQLECICQYLCLYYLVVIVRYLTSKNGGIDYEL